MEEQLSETSTKVAEYEVAIATLQGSQAKLQSENTDLASQLGDAESKNGSLSKANTNLTAQLDETKSELETEIAVSGGPANLTTPFIVLLVASYFKVAFCTSQLGEIGGTVQVAFRTE